MISKKLPIVLLSVMTLTANAQKTQPALLKILGKNRINPASHSSPKKTRSLERLEKSVSYFDTTESPNTTTPLLDNESFYYYNTNNNKAVKSIYEYGLFYSEVMANADSVENKSSQISFPTNMIDLFKYDNLDRLLSMTQVSKTNPLDTSTLDVYKYSGTNTEPDSIINLYNDGSAMVVSFITKNHIVNNRIIASQSFADQGAGFTLMSTDSFTYNANGDVTKSISISAFIPGKTTTLNYYNATNMIDSISSFVELGPVKIPSLEGKISYNASLTSAYARIYEYDNNLKIISNSSVLKLNGFKKVIESVDYFFDGVDSLGESKSNFEYTALGNIAKEYYTEFNEDSLKFNTASNDSTIYTYKSFSPLSNSGIEKQNIDFSIFPNPAKDAIFIAYESATSKKATLTVVDFAGKIVATKDVELVNGNSIVKIDISNLSKGNYLVKLTTDTETAEAIKFTKD